MMQQEINIAIGNKSPDVYFTEIKNQCTGGAKKYGGIDSMEKLSINLKRHCIPESVFSMDISHYDDFLKGRRMLIAQKIKNYYSLL